MNDDALSPDISGAYVQIWADAMAEVMGQVAGSPCPCRVLRESPAELVSTNERDSWIMVACSGVLRGEMSLRIPAASTLRLAQAFMSESPGSPVDLTPEHHEAVLELLRQMGGLAASAVKAAQGEVQFSLESASAAPSWPASSVAWFCLGEEASPLAVLELQISAALVASLRSDKPPSAQPEREVANDLQPDLRDDRINLNLLMDVELAVTVRFGSRRLLLREVLDLNPGSVISLDRQVQEPADLLLDGRVLARGEVVVVDGNYGLRVTEVGPVAN